MVNNCVFTHKGVHSILPDRIRAQSAQCCSSQMILLKCVGSGTLPQFISSLRYAPFPLFSRTQSYGDMAAAAYQIGSRIARRVNTIGIARRSFSFVGFAARDFAHDFVAATDDHSCAAAAADEQHQLCSSLTFLPTKMCKQQQRPFFLLVFFAAAAAAKEQSAHSPSKMILLLTD